MSQPTRDDRRQQLQDKLLAMGSLVEELLIESVGILQRCNLHILEQLSEDLTQIHRARLAIEMGCLSLIATRQPRDRQLRFLVAMVEMAADLAHIGEHARRVSRANYLVADQKLRRPLDTVHKLARLVQSSLCQVLEGFVTQDLALIGEAVAETQVVNASYEQTYQELLSVMRSKPRIVNQAIHLSRAAYNLKRAAERVTGMCEWVVFSIDGKVGQAAGIESMPIRGENYSHEQALLP